MRWPIQLQLLLPTLSVVILAIVLASGVSAYHGASRVRSQQEESLRRVVATMAEAAFPLTEKVLRQMSGLSGAEFVVLDASYRIQRTTLPVAGADLQPLLASDLGPQPTRFSADRAVAIGGRSYLGHRVSVRGRGEAGSPGWLVVLYPEDRWSAGIRQAAYPALVAGGAAALAVVVVTTVLARRFVRPIQRLGDQAAAIANGQFKAATVPTRDDEIRDLTVSINQMAERLSRYEEEVRRSERLRTLGQLGAGMAHQLRNAATGAWMAVELHQRHCSQKEDGESLQVAIRQLRLMESYLQRFLALGRPQAAERQRVVLQAVLDDVLELVGPACDHAKIALGVTKAAEPLEVWGDGEALRQLAINLILNGIEAASRTAESGAQVAIALEPVGADRVALRVGDSGPGPTPATQDNLFEPFVTDKPEGAGLGLYVARQIVEAHQGTIGWGRAGGMTWFVVELPLLIPESSHGTPAGR